MCCTMETIAVQLMITASHGGVMFLCTYCPGRQACIHPVGAFFYVSASAGVEYACGQINGHGRDRHLEAFQSKRGKSRFYSIAKVIPHDARHMQQVVVGYFGY